MTSAQESPLSKSSWKTCHIGAKRQSPKSIQTRRKPCGAPITIKQQDKQCQQSPSMEKHEQSQIHFDRMLTYKTTVESTKLRCKKALCVLKAMASKDIEQRHPFLLYQSVILCVIDHGLGLSQPCDSPTC